MRRALTLARKGEGLTRPNPPVGAVVVKKKQVIAEGYHRRAGGPHAEVVAIKKAGVQSKGATLYVTLEPCSTHGRTPPCTELIIQSGIKRVVVAMYDPNPEHAGRGLRMLKRKGIEVISGVCEEDATELLAPFARWITTGLPYVTLKLAMSMDGKLADRTGASKWITGAESRTYVQDLRRRCDAILVGANTVRCDDPHLQPRPARGHKVYRVVVAGGSLLPAKTRLFNDDTVARTIVAVGNGQAHKWKALADKKGFELMVCRERAGRVSVADVMKKLGKRGFLHVLCEGGGSMAEALVRQKIVDESCFFYAPKIIGGVDAVPAIGGKGWLMGTLPEMSICSVDRVGDDVMVRAKWD